VPTYEYECDRCHHVFEVRQRISEPPLSTHDGCGGAVRRLLSPAPFILKGGGWYVTDYPSEARRKAMSAEKSSGPTSPDKTDGAEKADKPAAAPGKSDAAGSTGSTGTGGTSDASSAASAPSG
jgi:putative FmdB family regulatory protein